MGPQSCTDGGRVGGWGGVGLFPIIIAYSQQTTALPFFLLHLDFRWPILHRVVTLETAPSVFIESNRVVMEKGEQTRLWCRGCRFPSSWEKTYWGHIHFYFIFYLAEALGVNRGSSLSSRPCRHIIPRLAACSWRLPFFRMGLQQCSMTSSGHVIIF